MKIDKDITLPASDNKLDLSVHIDGNSDANAVIIFSHGMAEHKERYYDFIHFLNNHGYLCVIHDHRGHGESVKDKNDYGYFYNDNENQIVEDLHMIIQFVKDKYPKLDRYLFSHSMGTLVSRNYLQKYDYEIKKIVFCGPPYDNKGAHLGYLIAKVIASLLGDKHRSKLIQKMAFNTFDKKFGGLIKNEWICSDHKQVEQYNNNPKCGFIFSANGFQCLFHLVKNCYKSSAYKVQNKQLKMLFIAGSEDPVIGNENKFLAEIRFMNLLGYKNTNYILYPNLRHEILNENSKEEIYHDILKFFTIEKEI